MTINVNSAIAVCWEALGIIWLLGLRGNRQTLRTSTGSTWWFHIVLGLLGFILLGTSVFSQGWMAIRFLPDTMPVELAGLGLTATGCLFAIWARVSLGRNWSGRPMVKSGHELVVTGPYRFTRHPIYTGLLTAVIGRGVAGGEWRCIVGFIVILLAMAVKIGQEERLMLQAFPEAYPRYRRRVKALIPGVL